MSHDRSFCRISLESSALSSLAPWKRNGRSEGQNWWISFIQFPSVDFGTMMRCGPLQWEKESTATRHGGTALRIPGWRWSPAFYRDLSITAPVCPYPSHQPGCCWDPAGTDAAASSVHPADSCASCLGCRKAVSGDGWSRSRFAIAQRLLPLTCPDSYDV